MVSRAYPSFSKNNFAIKRVDMDTFISVRFGKSSSPNYKKAISHAKKFQNFQAAIDTTQLNILNVSKAEIKLKSNIIESLWLLIGNWKSTELYCEGEQTTYNELKNIFKVLSCCEEYKKAVIQENHCKIYGSGSGWGCKFLSEIARERGCRTFYFESNMYWYDFGLFKGESVWQIDKVRLISALERETSVKNLTLCSVFDFEKTKRVVNQLPDEINLKDTSDWEVKYDQIEDGSVVEKRPVGIKAKSNNDTHFGIRFGVDIDQPNDENANVKEESTRNIPNISFSDIGGIDEIVGTIREVIELPLRMPEVLQYLGINPHKGVLLYGPPGCGKTLIAKAIANEISAHFISIRGPELLSKWHGESEENFRNIFEEARKFEPSIIYFDEIDSIAQSRSGAETSRLDSKFVNQLLTLMDGVETYGNVCVIASTNRKDLIDEALLRPGRFEYSIEVKKPTKEGSIEIFKIKTDKMPLSNTVNVEAFADKLHGLSGAEIDFVAKEGAYNCLRRNLNLKQIFENKEETNIEIDQFKIETFDFEKALNHIKGRV